MLKVFKNFKKGPKKIENFGLYRVEQQTRNKQRWTQSLENWSAYKLLKLSAWADLAQHFMLNHYQHPTIWVRECTECWNSRKPLRRKAAMWIDQKQPGWLIILITPGLRRNGGFTLQEILRSSPWLLIVPSFNYNHFVRHTTGFWCDMFKYISHTESKCTITDFHYTAGKT